MSSGVSFRHEVDELICRAVVSDRQDGDVHPIHTASDLLEARQFAVAQRRWSMLDQRHGRDVVEIDQRSAWPVAGVGDVVMSRAGVPVGVWAADCAPLLIFGDAGSVVGVHAGWRGLAAGVIDQAMASLCAHGERPVSVVLGPVIHGCCYEFGDDDLHLVAAGVHAEPQNVSATTAWGATALDVPAAVRAGFAAHDLVVEQVGPCTGCDPNWYSHRRQDAERHALVGWVERRDRADG